GGAPPRLVVVALGRVDRSLVASALMSTVVVRVSWSLVSWDHHRGGSGHRLTRDGVGDDIRPAVTTPSIPLRTQLEVEVCRAEGSPLNVTGRVAISQSRRVVRLAAGDRGKHDLRSPGAVADGSDRGVDGHHLVVRRSQERGSQGDFD